jgi:ATP-dependent Clp protease ATP-binding subunit ClpB
MRDLRGKEHNNIVFMNEIHTLNPKQNEAGAHQSELGQQIKTFIETGKLHLIGATTEKEYEEHIEWDVALNRRFIRIFLEQSPNCDEILETSLEEQYPTVTIEKDVISFAVSETDKIFPEIAQPAKAKDVLTEAARTVLGNYGEEEKKHVEQPAKLRKERRLLKRDITNAAKAATTAALVDEVKQTAEVFTNKRQELKAFMDLKHSKIRAEEHLTRLAHRIAAEPEKSDLEMKSFILVCKLLDKTKEAIEVKEDALDKKGWRVKVTTKLVKELLPTNLAL